MGVLVNLPSTLTVGGVHARLNAALNLIALSPTPYSRGTRPVDDQRAILLRGLL